MSNKTPDELIFQETPEVEFATNRFLDVPVILQYEATPLIEVVRYEQAGFTTQINIHHSDGTYLAKVVGSRLLATADGKKAGLKMRHPAGRTVCELGDQTLFEIRRKEAAALKTEAELYTPDGAFVKGSDAGLRMMRDLKDVPLRLGRVLMQGNRFRGCKIGVHVRADGSVGICVP